MKRILLLALIAAALHSCDKNEVADPPEPAEIPFIGTWSRQFEAGPGNVQTATYKVYQDSIRYTLTGPIGQADYVMNRDTFLLQDNRFIGMASTDVMYLILVQDFAPDSIVLYKEEVAHMNHGLNVPVPGSVAQGHGWNTYLPM